MNYMNVLIHGSDKQKEEYTFKLIISDKNKKSFNLNDFTYFLSSMVNAWGIITSTFQSIIS